MTLSSFDINMSEGYIFNIDSDIKMGLTFKGVMLSEFDCILSLIDHQQ